MNAYEYGQGSFKVKMGAEAIQDLLKQVDLEKEIAELKDELKTATGQKRVKVISLLDVLDAFQKSGNKPEWDGLKHLASYSGQIYVQCLS